MDTWLLAAVIIILFGHLTAWAVAFRGGVFLIVGLLCLMLPNAPPLFRKSAAVTLLIFILALRWTPANGNRLARRQSAACALMG